MQDLREYRTASGWSKDWQETRKRHPKAARCIDAIANTYQKRIVNVNVNVLAAAYPSIAAAAYTSERMQEANYTNNAIAIGAGVVDWVAFIPVHIGLHYLSNRKRFSLAGKLQQKEFWRDTWQVYVTSVPSMITFYALAGPAQKLLMDHHVDAHNANLLSYWGTFSVTRTIHTIIGYRTGLFRELPTKNLAQ